ncbi:hypothetical protein C8Q70DRAFT_596244 [Cubamyces menziesii]|nr:hypothetical protein C8Q70DRAFT_596244 [Cubamyces menziesii]
MISIAASPTWPLPRAATAPPVGTGRSCFEECGFPGACNGCLDAINNALSPRSTDTVACCPQVIAQVAPLLFCARGHCGGLVDSVQKVIGYCQSHTETAASSPGIDPTSSSPVQRPSPTTQISQPIPPSDSPSAAQQSSGVLTATPSGSSYTTMMSPPPDRLDSSTPSTNSEPQSSSETWTGTANTTSVETGQVSKSAGNSHHTFPHHTCHSWDTSLADPAHTHTSSCTTKHNPHPPLVAIASVIGGVLVFALLAALCLCLRRLKRRRTHAESRVVTVSKTDEDPESSSEVYARCILGDVVNGPETSWGPLPSLVESIHDPRADILTPDRNPSSLEGGPLLRHNTASTSSLISSVHSISTIEGNGHESDPHLEPLGATDDTNSARFIANGFVSRTIRDSWGSDESFKSTGEGATEANSTEVTGWHPSRMVRPLGPSDS